MENSTVSGLRSRSRSKTPFLRSSCDRESCNDETHTHTKSGRKTPVKRTTPVKQIIQQSTAKKSSEPIIIEDDEEPAPAPRTRKSARTAAEKLITSDYSSGESPDRLTSRRVSGQNEVNYKRYEEHVTTTSSVRRIGGSLVDVSLSPIQANLTTDRSTRFGSPAYSHCSTDSSFAEQALADASTLLELDPKHSADHLPSRLYRMAGEYWNKYPKTDYTYSRLSRDRVELAPGQVAVPNMSRRSLSQFRVQGPVTTPEEVEMLTRSSYSSASQLKKRYTSVENSDDEYDFPRYTPIAERWLLTKVLISIVTIITTTVTNTVTYPVKLLSNLRSTSHQTRNEPGLLSKTGSALVAPVYWIYSVIRKIVTTTVTTVTETISPSANHVHSTYRLANNRQATTEVAKKRWWPWLLLFLLPFGGYACYHYDVPGTLAAMGASHVEFKAPEAHDPDLTKRLTALEGWAVFVDSKLKSFNDKVSKLDNIEATIEAHSLKHLQQNLIQVFNLNSDNSEIIAAKLKQYFDKHYVSKEQMTLMSAEMYDRLADSMKDQVGEDKIRLIVQEYLSAFEKRQHDVLVQRVREYVREVQVKREVVGFDEDAVRGIVTSMLEIYDADKTGMVDYALESAGGQVISTKCTEQYQIKTKQYFILDLPVWWVSTSPRNALTPGAMPAECWAFQNFPGYLVVRLYAIIEVTGFSVEHMSRLLAVDGKIESAPKNFSVFGLRDELDHTPHRFGDYMYDANSTAIQYFPVQYPKTENIGGIEYPVAYDIIELRIESNHGNPTYTCVYRFKVHGNPLSDIRRATEDSIKDSES